MLGRTARQMFKIKGRFQDVILVMLIIALFWGCNNTANHNAPTTGADSSGIATVKQADKLAATKTDSINSANADIINAAGNHINKAIISKSDSLVWLTANIKIDHRIFGYNRPDTNARKMILISIFTGDVEGNPFNCPLGAYYQTSDMEKMIIKFTGTEGRFIKAKVTANDNTGTDVYFEKKWIEFEN